MIEGGSFERISPEDTQKIVADNAARLYGLN
jgi:predicted TIM-barrel fold metal-dependent hydrolase